MIVQAMKLNRRSQKVSPLMGLIKIFMHEYW